MLKKRKLLEIKIVSKFILIIITVYYNCIVVNFIDLSKKNDKNFFQNLY